jgi:hypothetical protein
MHDDHPTAPTAIKVLLAGMPGLLASVVCHTVNEERDMAVVGQIGSGEDLAGALRQPVDVVVTAAPTPDLPPELQALLFGPAPLPIVTISLDGERVDVYGRSITHGGGIHGLATLIRDAVTGARPRTGG